VKASFSIPFGQVDFLVILNYSQVFQTALTVVSIYHCVWGAEFGISD